MGTLAILLLLAAAGYLLARAMRVPVIPLLLLLGMTIPLTGVQTDTATLREIFELGLIFLVFSAGTELTPRRAGRYLPAVMAVGIGQFVIIGAAGFGLCLLLGFDSTSAVYLALGLSASSTLVVVRHLKERQQMFEPFGRLVTGVLFLQDLLIIAGIVIVLRAPAGLSAVVVAAMGATALGLLAMACRRWLIPRLVLTKTLGEEERLLVVLALLFVFLGAASLVNVPLVAGAFLAGMALSGFPTNGVIRGLLRPLQDFFLAVFFVSLGAIIVIPTGWGLVLAGLLVVFVILVTTPLVTFLAERRGFSARASLESGLLLSQTSEFSMVIALHGLVLGHISQEVFSILGVVTVATMTLTPFLATDRVTWSLMRFHPLRRGPGVAGGWRGHVLLLGYGASGERLLKSLQASGREVVVVDEDPVVLRDLRRRGIACLRGDASDRDLLSHARAAESSAIVCTVRRRADAEKVLQAVAGRGVPVLVRVFDPEGEEVVRKLGGIPLNASDAAAKSFTNWFDVAFPKESDAVESERD
jgi:monovalent cation:H+ antiporter-2, CPA2 family